MKEHTLTPPRLIRGNRYGRIHWGIRFHTRATPALTELYRLCYPNGRKAISIAWLKQLTAFSLAVWYMDDGSYAPGPGRHFCMLYTGAFPYSQQRLIADYFRCRWEITGFAIQHNRRQWCFRFNREGTQQLLRIIEPYVMKVLSMRYKLGYPEQGWKVPVQVSMDRYANAWRRNEDNVLRAHYGHVRARVLAERLGRTVIAVQLRARKLGLKGWPDRVSDEHGCYVASIN